MLRYPTPKCMQFYYIFENVSMSRGALFWVEKFWNYNAKVIDY
jgi:hypothetical protein